MLLIYNCVCACVQSLGFLLKYIFYISNKLPGDLNAAGL